MHTGYVEPADLTSGYPGECSRCGALPGQRCRDISDKPRRQGLKKGQFTETAYCINECHDGGCNVFWMDGILWFAPRRSNRYRIERMDLETAVRRHKSLWHRYEKANSVFWYSWYRGRWARYKDLCWWSIYPCPFPVRRPTWICDIETRQQYNFSHIVDLDILLEEDNLLSFLDERNQSAAESVPELAPESAADERQLSLF